MGPKVSWHVKTKEEALREQGSTQEWGLSSHEARQRRSVYGRNELVESRQRGPLQLFWAQLTEFMVVVLLEAGATVPADYRFKRRVSSLLARAFRYRIAETWPSRELTSPPDGDGRGIHRSNNG